MRKPSSSLGSLALVCLMMGGAFFLVGFMNAQLFLWAVPFLAAGLLLLWKIRKDNAAAEKLITQGQRVPGKILSIRQKGSMTLGFMNAKPRTSLRHPWIVTCQYTWEGQTYTAKSQYLWLPPRDNSPDVRVCFDPAAPGQGVVDPATLRFIPIR